MNEQGGEQQENQESQKPNLFMPQNSNTRVFAHHCFAQPPSLDFVFASVLAGSVAGIIAPGSTGKGFFTIGLCFDLYTGQNLLGLGIGIETPVLNADQKIAFVTLEDQKVVVADRLHKAIKKYEMTADETIRMDEQVHFMSVQGELVMDLVNQRGKISYLLANQMIAAYKNYRLIFLDTLSRTHTANENDNGNMSVLISVFEYIAKHTGAALVFTHHTNKCATNQGGEAGASRGATAIVDNIRSLLSLTKMTKEEAIKEGIPPHLHQHFVWVHDSKVNYTETKPPRILERVKGAGGMLSEVHNPRPQNKERVCTNPQG